MQKRHKLFVASSEVEVARSEKPEHLFLYSPSVVRTASGSIVISHDIGGDRAEMQRLEHYRAFPDSEQAAMCKILAREGRNDEFRCVKHLNMCHGRLFRVGSKTYIIGHNGRLQIAVGNEHGTEWSDLHCLHPELSGWHAAACNVLVTRERVYLCMERRADRNYKDWNVAGLVPHVLSARISSDLTRSESWRVSDAFSFADLFQSARFAYFGLPFYATGYRWAARHIVHGKAVKSSPMGWLEGNIVQFTDKNHVWFDESQRVFHLFLRCNTAGVGYAAVLKVAEDLNGDLFTELVRVPSGEPLVFVPFPGGHNKFYILYDVPSQLYWMACSQSSDSMSRLDALPPSRFGLPNNERHRLALYFSKNCIDWLFAGMLSVGKNELHARNYPAMEVDGDDLLVVVRAGDDSAKDSQYSNLINLCTVKKFRDLVY